MASVEQERAGQFSRWTDTTPDSQHTCSHLQKDSWMSPLIVEEKVEGRYGCPTPLSWITCRTCNKDTYLCWPSVTTCGPVLWNRKRSILGPRSQLLPQRSQTHCPSYSFCLQDLKLRATRQSVMWHWKCCSTGMEPVSYGQVNRLRTVLLGRTRQN